MTRTKLHMASARGAFARASRSALVLALAIALGALVGVTGGCAGELPPGLTPKTDGNVGVKLDSGPWSYPDQGTFVPVDTGTINTQDKGAADSAAPKPDTLKPDTAPPKPDTGPPPPQTGGPCPCAAGLYCIAGACRATCPAPTDPCGVDTTCPAQNACVKTDKAGVWVCMPSTTPGGACNASTFCPTKHVCGSVNGGGYQCLPTCMTGACGGGGQCLSASNGCKFCSAP
jgi:hypothetical protein